MLPALPPGDPDWSTGVARVLEDHRAIREAAAGLDATTTTPPEAANALGERLNGHIRFEERELFGLLERRLKTDELERLGFAIDEAEVRT